MGKYGASDLHLKVGSPPILRIAGAVYIAWLAVHTFMSARKAEPADRAALGFAHVGVLKVLEREGVPIDYIAGTSFGALVGGLYALGLGLISVEHLWFSGLRKLRPGDPGP